MSIAALVPLPVVLPLLGAGFTLLFAGRVRLQNAVTVGTLTAVLAIGIVLLVGVDSGGTQVVAVGGWQLPFGIALVVDRLSALMLVVSTIVTLGVLLYAVGQEMADTSRETPVSVFNPAYLILCAGVANAFIAGDLFNLYVGFEMLLAASYVLLTLGATADRIRVGATYIVISLVSSLVFLVAIALVYAATGTVNMAQLSQRLDQLPADVQLILHIALLLGFGIKAAVFPLSFWLPDSYPTAPAPVTAVFAGLLTKVGIYAIIRTETVIFIASNLRVPLLVVAGLTMIVGILGAIAQTEIKRMLSFTLVSHIGYLLFGVAMGTVAGLAAALFYTVHHIIVQTALFLAVGLVEQRAGTTSTRRLGGLALLSPLLAVLFFVPGLNFSGIPPFSGFIGKVALFQAGAEGGDWLNYALIAAGALTSLLTLYVIGRTWNLAFWRDPDQVEEPTPELVDEMAHLRESRSRQQALRRRAEKHAGEQGRPVPEAPIAPAIDTVPQQAAPARLPLTMVLPTAAMVAVSVALTVFAGPLWALSTRAAENLHNPGAYAEQVLGPDAVEAPDNGSGQVIEDAQRGGSDG
ncbi:Na+/H+ antiporter subunit D [Brevibacterium sp. BRM-1]|uniref:Na+/H+ antiporter subunit D n=1 Tax=Brevibacterium sp. BRM-1 TaxID=2999062 RepID=UPI0022819C4B|nr:Na+/H+ antiporter subunit D [Brevibacterium sp. BRM-1]WAL39733.1 Na+/H+ antiporter subunit D [Brevibacterium sp. BRM-1]